MGRVDSSRSRVKMGWLRSGNAGAIFSPLGGCAGIPKGPRQHINSHAPPKLLPTGRPATPARSTAANDQRTRSPYALWPRCITMPTEPDRPLFDVECDHGGSKDASGSPTMSEGYVSVDSILTATCRDPTRRDDDSMPASPLCPSAIVTRVDGPILRAPISHCRKGVPTEGPGAWATA
jgi:hypothetical protein